MHSTSAPPPLVASPLGLQRVEQAYPLVHMLHPLLTMDEWRSYARGLLTSDTPGRGVMSVQHDGYIRGLFCHWPVRSLQHGSIMIVDNFLVTGIFGTEETASTLIEAMELVAARHGCGAVQTLLTDRPQTDVHIQLQARGHRIAKVVLNKMLFSPAN